MDRRAAAAQEILEVDWWWWEEETQPHYRVKRGVLGCSGAALPDNGAGAGAGARAGAELGLQPTGNLIKKPKSGL